jgi:2'-5' RNA ligase
MTSIIAIDVAILPPPDVTQRAIALSGSLPSEDAQGLRLDADHLPHVTLTQQFVRVDGLAALLDQVDEVLRQCPPLPLRVTGGGKGSSSVWMAIERTAALVDLHERLLLAMQPFEVAEGGVSAFVDGDARDRDVSWVREYRRASSFTAFTPHITLGHGEEPPRVEPMDFPGTKVAACHLGRFCTCRRILRVWELAPKS